MTFKFGKLELCLFVFFNLLVASPAVAQCNGVFPNNTACGNITGGNNTPRAIPLTSFPANSPGGATGNIQYNLGGGLFGGLTDQQTEARVQPFLPLPSGGRLTLVSGSPEMSTDVSSTNLYLAPDQSTTCPVLVAGVWTNQTITASATDQVGLTLALAGSSNWAVGTIHDVFCIVNSGVVTLATRAWDSAMLPTTTQITNATTITTGTGSTAWVRATAAFNGTVSQPDASSARNTPSNTGLTNCLGQDWGVGVTKLLTKVIVTAPTDDVLRGDGPTVQQIREDGSADNVNWRILDVRQINASTIGTSYTIPINPTYSTPYRYHRTCINGNGTSAINVAQIQYFTTTPPTTRRLSRYNGTLTNDASMTARIGASTTVTTAINEGTYLGSIQIDAATPGTITANFSFGASRQFGIWNYYNPKTITILAGIPTTATPYTYSLASPANIDWGPIQGSSTFSATILVGYPTNAVNATLPRTVYLQNASGNGGYESGISVDTTGGFCGTEGDVTIDTTGQNIGLWMQSTCSIPPFFGTHTIYGVEKLAYAPAGTVSLFTDIRNSGIYITTTY